MTGHFPGDAGGQADEPLAVLAEHVLVDPGLVVEPFHFPNRHQLHQVLVAGLVFRQKDQMVQFAPGFQAFVQMGPGSDVHFAADDGFDPGFLTFLVEFNDPVHDPVVRNGQGRHPQLLGILDQFRDPAGPIQEAVLGMGMQMDELVHGCSFKKGGCAAAPVNGRLSMTYPLIVFTSPGRYMVTSGETSVSVAPMV